MERRYLAVRLDTSLARNHNVSLIRFHAPPCQAPRLPGRVSYIRKATTRPESIVRVAMTWMAVGSQLCSLQQLPNIVDNILPRCDGGMAQAPQAFWVNHKGGGVVIDKVTLSLGTPGSLLAKDTIGRVD